MHFPHYCCDVVFMDECILRNLGFLNLFTWTIWVCKLEDVENNWKNLCKMFQGIIFKLNP